MAFSVFCSNYKDYLSHQPTWHLAVPTWAPLLRPNLRHVARQGPESVVEREAESRGQVAPKMIGWYLSSWHYATFRSSIGWTEGGVDMWALVRCPLRKTFCCVVQMKREKGTATFRGWEDDGMEK
ncbi:hypothetical protein AMTR_s00053p00171400 [Amborella trichopoda]|uniref:Uncharacterized protein n=1 Tax=Amborella trichopoda TaxID=13333 RepID=W1PBY2_AMBTC|nr:hypothetical protein AMTR_s00053p00171400 [Amborella trichopoda]